MKNKKYTIRKKIHYVLDDYISKGFLAQLVLLLAVAAVLILIFGVILTIYGEEKNLSDAVWESLMHMIDQGTITGEDSESDNFLQLMLVLTFIGMAFTSTIIAIISSSIQEKMHDLRKGHSAIIEKDHVVVMGFNENTYTISHEIAENGMRTRLKDCIVIVDDIEKEKMENDAKGFLQSRQQFFEKSDDEKRRFRKSRLVFRSGDLISEHTFEMCAMERARAIIINRENDLETVRILLALVSYLRKNKSYISDEYMPSIVAMIHDEENLTAAKNAAGILHRKGRVVKEKNEHKIRVLYYKEIFASLFAQACVNPGLPFVLDSLFNSYAASVCIEKETEEGEEESQFAGKNIFEISEQVPGCIPIGFARTDEEHQIHVLLNPGKEEKYGRRDRLIYLSHKDALRTGEPEKVIPAGTPAVKEEESLKRIRHFLLIGWTGATPRLVRNIKEYCLKGSAVDIISDDPEGSIDGNRFTLDCSVHNCGEPYRFSRIKAILEEHPEWFDKEHPAHLTNIVILSGDSQDKTEADEKVAVLLLNIRQYLQEKENCSISITSEMYLPKDQNLMQDNSGNDFIVASEISNRMLAQIAGDPRKYYVIDELLKQSAAAVELKKISVYMDVNGPFNFEGVFREVCSRAERNGERELPLGWIRLADPSDSGENGVPSLVLAPSAEERGAVIKDGVFGGSDRYRLVILTEGVGTA